MRNPENPRSLGPVMTSLPDLPPIVDSILDSLWEDNTTLSSCSLVCRQWLNPSRRRLFHTIRIAKHADQLAGFLDLLLSSFTPRDHIQRLIIAPAIYAYPEEDIPLWDLIYVILTKLHNLTALTLQYIPLCQWTPDFFPRTIKLKRLFIGSLVTSQFLERELRSFLGLYAGVDELCVGTIRRGRSISTMYPPITNSFRLPVRKLTVEEPHVLPALRNILCPQTIRSLSVRLGRWATATHSDVIFHTNTFLEVVGPSLRHLDIRPTPFSIPGMFVNTRFDVAMANEDHSSLLALERTGGVLLHGA